MSGLRATFGGPVSAGPQGGAVLLAVLVLLALLAYASVSLPFDFSGMQQRADEEELLFVGRQYRQAIDSYLRQSPGGPRAFPASLEDLLNDNRFPQPRHHLRKMFRDPVAPDQPWVLIKIGNAIVGVHSQSGKQPFRSTGFGPNEAGFANARSYAEWEFKVSTQPSLPPPPTAPGTQPKPQPRPPLVPRPKGL